MVLIVDNSERKRGRELRERFFESGIPCALVNMETLKKTAPAVFTIVYAENETQLSIASIRAGATEYIVINDTGRKMFNHDAHMYDPNADGDIVEYILKRGSELFGVDGREPDVPPVRFCGDETFYRNKHLRLTEQEKMILRHLILSKGEWHTANELLRYAYRTPHLRVEETVRTHICNINRKANAAAGQKLIIACRGFGYRADFPAPPPRKYGHYELSPEKPLFV